MRAISSTGGRRPGVDFRNRLTYPLYPVSHVSKFRFAATMPTQLQSHRIRSLAFMYLTFAGQSSLIDLMSEFGLRHQQARPTRAIAIAFHSSVLRSFCKYTTCTEYKQRGAECKNELRARRFRISLFATIFSRARYFHAHDLNFESARLTPRLLASELALPSPAPGLNSTTKTTSNRASRPNRALRQT